MSFQIPVSVIKPKAFADIFSKVIKIGMTAGKLSIAIKVELLAAFPAIAEMKVKEIENPILPSSKAIKN